VSTESAFHEPALYRELTVARTRSREGADHIEVMFFESPQIFRLPRDDARFDVLLDRLVHGARVDVGLASLDSDVIRDVKVG
jgi:hypothetical protein